MRFLLNMMKTSVKTEGNLPKNLPFFENTIEIKKTLARLITMINSEENIRGLFVVTFLIREL